MPTVIQRPLCRVMLLLLLAVTQAVAQTQQPPVGGGGGGWSQNLVTNVTDAPYSATGNGTTNDTAAIVAAIAATPDGGTVWFPAGTYIVENINVTNRHGLTLLGTNDGKAVLKRL